MYKSCRICKLKTKNIHRHHILPKSRGGRDDENNLINVCVECHSKIHDVSFKGVNGLIKKAQIKAKEKYNQDLKWLDNNWDIWIDLVMKIYDENPEKANFISVMQRNGFINASDCKELIETGEAKFKRAMTINIKDII